MGNPNTGKSTIFNALSGAQQKVSNLPGVTIEKKLAEVRLADKKITFVDLPGCYSLQATSKDERVATDYLLGKLTEKNQVLRKPDLILFILDSTNLKRNLYLLSQTIQLEIPIVVIATMTDLLEKEGVHFDTYQLSKQLGFSVISVVGKESRTIENLKKELNKDSIFIKPQNQLMDKIMSEYLKLNTPIKKISKTIMPQIHYRWVNSIMESFKDQKKIQEKPWVRYLDTLLTSRYSGFLVFLGIMYTMFQLIYSWAKPVMDFIEGCFAYLSTALTYSWLSKYPIIYSLISDGVLQGAGSVIIFLPQVVLLFIFIALLEDSGYITRAVFLMDKIFSWSGLNGRSFVPMLSSFACAVPGIMSARVIADPKIRLATILVSPLMSCSARLPIYILMIGTFIEPKYGSFWATLTLFLMHIIGPILSLPISRLITGTYQRHHKPIFFMEMPPYRLPSFRNILYRGYHAGSKFLVKAGGIILLFSIIIWALSYFPRDPTVAHRVNQQYNKRILKLKEQGGEKNLKKVLLEKEQELSSQYLEKSYLGRIGKNIQPIFSPLGFDWKITVGLLSAFPAREVIIASLSILYNTQNDSDLNTSGLRHRLISAKKKDGTPAYNLPFAISLMTFFSLCCQCLSTLAVMYRELNSWIWPVITFVYMTSLAYILSLFVYQIGSFFI